MTQAKIEPGETGISLAGRQKPRNDARDDARDDAGKNHLRPERDEASSAKKKSGQPKAGPLDRGISLGD